MNDNRHHKEVGSTDTEAEESKVFNNNEIDNEKLNSAVRDHMNSRHDENDDE
jgi:hypothetical protein